MRGLRELESNKKEVGKILGGIWRSCISGLQVSEQNDDEEMGVGKGETWR